MDEGARAERRLALLRRQEADPRRRTCTRSARRPAARTSPSAGAAAPRRSRSSATPARAPAATATSTRASPSIRRIRSSRCGSRRPRRRWSLKHVVVTSVDRDDLPDKGAGHYAATIRALKAKVPDGDDRGPDTGLPRLRGGGAPDRARRAAGRLQPQHRDRPPAAPEDARRQGDYDRALWLLARAKEVADYPVLTKSRDHRRARRDERRGRRDDARSARERRRRRHDRPVPPAVARSTRRSTAGCTRTSSAGSASRARRSASARSSRDRSSARATGATSSATPPKPVAAQSRTRRKEGRLGGGPLSSRRLVTASAAVDFRVVDVLLGSVAPDRARVRPDDVRVTVMVGVDPHVVAQEAGLHRVVRRRSGSASSSSSPACS